MKAFYRTHPTHEGTLLHIMREEPVPPRRTTFGQPWPRGECNITAQPKARSEAVILDPWPETPPPGLRWCSRCLGQLAQRLYALDELAALLHRRAAATPTDSRAAQRG
jgi:hypothetical protein